MKIKIVILFNLLTVFSFSQVMWQIKKDTVIKWHYYDGDEFDISYLDMDKWIPAYSYSEMNYRFDYLMTPKRLEFVNGVCRFMCYRDTGLYTLPGWQMSPTFEKDNDAKLIDGNKVRYLFTAGNVWSKNEYEKGYFEMRFKSSDAYGMWPAFWLYGTNQKDEIDFFELKGEKNKEIHIDVHCPSGCDSHYKGGNIFPQSFGGWIKTTGYLKDDYNVLAGEWQDGYVKWYLNGVGIGYYKGDFISKKMSLIIGTGPAKDKFPFSPGVNKATVFPNSLDVDYVRVWYKNEKPKDALKGKQHTEFSYYKDSVSAEATLKKKISYMYNKKEFKNDVLTVSILPASNQKMLLTSLGKKIYYKITFSEPGGKELLSQAINTSFTEFDFSKITSEKQLKVKIKTPLKEFEELVRIQK